MKCRGLTGGTLCQLHIHLPPNQGASHRREGGWGPEQVGLLGSHLYSSGLLPLTTLLLTRPHFSLPLLERAGSHLQALAFWVLGRCSDLLGGDSPTECAQEPHRGLLCFLPVIPRPLPLRTKPNATLKWLMQAPCCSWSTVPSYEYPECAPSVPGEGAESLLA